MGINRIPDTENVIRYATQQPSLATKAQDPKGQGLWDVVIAVHMGEGGFPLGARVRRIIDCWGLFRGPLNPHTATELHSQEARPVPQKKILHTSLYPQNTEYTRTTQLPANKP